MTERALRRVCVYCGSSPGLDPAYLACARATGALLAARQIGLVYGGGRVGLMGAVADATLAAGGEVIGVVPQALSRKELAHAELTALHVVEDMHTRKAMMASLSDGFIALPGGLGTFDELFEMWTWAQLGFHNKPIGLLNVLGFYSPLRAFVSHASAQGFLQAQHLDLLQLEDTPEALIDAMASYNPTYQAKWAELDAVTVKP